MFGKVVKRILQGLGFILGTVILIGTVFISVSPEFGGSPTDSDKEEYQKTGHFNDGVFVNIQETTMDMGWDSVKALISESIEGNPNKRPDFEIPVIRVTPSELIEFNATRLIWFGHSAFLLQIDGKNILLDPMLGEVPSPHPLLGTERFNKELPIEIADLPEIDAIVISHDHYDHLDYGSIEQLKSKTKMFYVPLGVGAHFKSWGVDAKQIIEMDWWQSNTLDGLTFSFTPSRHFSGRGIFDRNTTLWGSWVIKGEKDNIYFSGDGGYGPHFKEIGEKYGPFDLALMECGQYNPKWSQIHMMPEQTAQAGKDVRANQIIPMHWAAFTLAFHSWTDPVERVLRKSKDLGLPIITPKIGEEIYITTDGSKYHETWWVN